MKKSIIIIVIAALISFCFILLIVSSASTTNNSGITITVNGDNNVVENINQSTKISSPDEPDSTMKRMHNAVISSITMLLIVVIKVFCSYLIKKHRITQKNTHSHKHIHRKKDR